MNMRVDKSCCGLHFTTGGTIHLDNIQRTLFDMACKATVLYPNDDDLTFDLVYYLNTHMSLVHSTWRPHGLEHWDVVQFGNGADGVKSVYHIQANLTFRNTEALEAAMADPGTKAIFDDVANFTNKAPIFVAGAVVGISA